MTKNFKLNKNEFYKEFQKYRIVTAKMENCQSSGSNWINEFNYKLAIKECRHPPWIKHIYSYKLIIRFVKMWNILYMLQNSIHNNNTVHSQSTQSNQNEWNSITLCNSIRVIAGINIPDYINLKRYWFQVSHLHFPFHSICTKVFHLYCIMHGFLKQAFK